MIIIIIIMGRRRRGVETLRGSDRWPPKAGTAKQVSRHKSLQIAQRTPAPFKRCLLCRSRLGAFVRFSGACQGHLRGLLRCTRTASPIRGPVMRNLLTQTPEFEFQRKNTWEELQP